MAKSEIDPALLRKLLRYEPETGKLYWLARSANLFREGSRCSPEAQASQWNSLYAETPALQSRTQVGYLKGGIFGRDYLSHRVAWALHFGHWPDGQIDHINGDRGDNRIENLRCVTSAENNRNRRIPSSNTSGRIGVFWHAVDGCWRAQIKHAGKQVHLGSFQTREAAVAAREKAESELGFHQNHGRAA